jgi:hypothetical protein
MSGTATDQQERDSAQAGSHVVQQVWEVGDVGFDTEKKLWFVQLYNEVNQAVGTYMGKTILLRRGRAAQYEWKDVQGRPFWHVRERFFADQIEGISPEPGGERLTLTFKAGAEQGSIEAPLDFSYLLYAFHLSNREISKGNKPPLGFVEFYDTTGKLLRTLNNVWVVIEDVDRKSVGEYPKIRLRVERNDVERIVVTRSTIIIQGKLPQ